MQAEAKTPPAAPSRALDQLGYFVEWRPRIWGPAVRWLAGDPARFQGRRVLDVGCRYGRMSCFFALLGADVTGVDMGGVSLERARAEAERWGVSERIRFENYDGDPATIPGDDFDFVFTKSVLVVVPQLETFLAKLAARMNPEGELLLAENTAGNPLLNWFRRVVVHRQWRSFQDNFHGVDERFWKALDGSFRVTAQRRFFFIVAAARAQKRAQAR